MELLAIIIIGYIVNFVVGIIMSIVTVISLLQQDKVQQAKLIVIIEGLKRKALELRSKYNLKFYLYTSSMYPYASILTLLSLLTGPDPIIINFIRNTERMYEYIEEKLS